MQLQRREEDLLAGVPARRGVSRIAPGASKYLWAQPFIRCEDEIKI